MDATTNQLFQLLTSSLHERGSHPPGSPVTVAEIYRELVPYREVRERLGVDLNADYEHALLRLLAGEGKLLRLEPSAAREELQRELESPNPYVGIYRKFAACDVWIEGDPVEAVPADLGPLPETSKPVTPLPGPSLTPELVPAPVPTSRPDEVCPYCSKPNPAGREIHFCPFCGKDQNTRPCPRCAEVLEVGWQYCIACGSSV